MMNTEPNKNSAPSGFLRFLILAVLSYLRVEKRAGERLRAGEEAVGLLAGVDGLPQALLPLLRLGGLHGQSLQFGRHVGRLRAFAST